MSNKETIKAQKIRRRILALFAKSPGTTADATRMLDITRAVAQTAMRKLCNERKLMRVGVGEKQIKIYQTSPDVDVDPDDGVYISRWSMVTKPWRQGAIN